MEDQERGMDSNQQVESPQKENLPLSNTISIMIMAGIGRICTFTISRRFLMGAALFFLFYILFSIFIISEFFTLRLRHRALSDRFEEVENKYNDIEKDLLHARQRAANFEAYIESIGEQKEERDIIPVEVPQEASAGDKSIGATEIGIEVMTDLVDVEGLTIKKLDTGLSVDFRLTNIDSGIDAIEGFVHIMVYDKNNNLPTIWNSSSRYTEDGLPSDFRSGQRFVIHRFKQYHREFMADNTLGMPETISILAYDTVGNLIFKRDYDVNDVS